MKDWRHGGLRNGLEEAEPRKREVGCLRTFKHRPRRDGQKEKTTFSWWWWWWWPPGKGAMQSTS